MSQVKIFNEISILYLQLIDMFLKFGILSDVLRERSGNPSAERTRENENGGKNGKGKRWKKEKRKRKKRTPKEII